MGASPNKIRFFICYSVHPTGKIASEPESQAGYVPRNDLTTQVPGGELLAEILANGRLGRRLATRELASCKARKIRV